MDSVFKNGSGYADPTAYTAIKSIDKEDTMDFSRGEIWDIRMETAHAYKQVLVVSADFRKEDSRQSVIFMSDKPQGMVNVKIDCGGTTMYVDCGNISYIQTSRLDSFICRASHAEMDEVSEGMRKCLGIEGGGSAKVIEKPVYVNNTEELLEAKAEAKVYKDLYNSLLERMMR